MNTIRNIPLLALVASLAACQGGNAPPSTDAGTGTGTASTASTARKPAETQSGLVGMVGAAMDKARAEMATKNIGIGDGASINFNGIRINSGASKAPRAEITPQGDLLIAGKAVEVDPAQRALLLQYRGEIIDVASAGMEMGKQGVGIAGKAVSSAIAGIFNGKSDQAQQDLEAEGKRMEASAMQLCERLRPMMETQKKLAAALPAFQPYANLTQSDIDDCRDRKNDSANPAQPTQAEIRRQIRDGIREEIRSVVREPSTPAVDAASEADAAAASG